MTTSAAGIIFSSLNDHTLSRLTGDRTVAAIPFACRYRLIDFCLSNMVNADISNISVVANYNYRSLLEHLGSGKDWDLARRHNGINLISPFQTARKPNAAMFSTHMQALRNMREYINEYKEEYVVLMDSDYILNIDLKAIIKNHEQTGANVTFVTHKVDKEYSSKSPKMMVSSVAGKISDIAMSAAYNDKNPELALNIFVMKVSYLKKLLDEADAYALDSLTKFFLDNYRRANYRTYCYNGFVASVSSFLDYYKYSIQLTTDTAARESLLWKKEAPIFTKVHNSSPTTYTSDAKVENSMIADECDIQGTVINSVIFRGVKIAKGAVIRNSILFQGTVVSENAQLNCIVTDKDVYISNGVSLSGNDNMPFYVQKSRKV